MKWCLSSTQIEEYLKKADEIKIFWQDRKKLDVFGLLEINPEARILIFPAFDLTLFDEDYQLLEQQLILCKGNMAVIVADDRMARQCKNRNIPFFFGYPARTFAQLNRMEAWGASDAYIDDALCHSLDLIHEFHPNITIRVTANSCGWGTVKDIWDGLEGSWFRPEDLWKLEQIQVAEFKTDLEYVSNFEQLQTVKKQEQALYRIYAEDHEWSGKVDDFVFDIKRTGMLNRLFDEDFQNRRSNCRMRCMETHRCHHCEVYAALTSEDTVEKMKNRNIEV